VLEDAQGQELSASTQQLHLAYSGLKSGTCYMQTSAYFIVLYQTEFSRRITALVVQMLSAGSKQASIFICPINKQRYNIDE